jgi:hypothetical protein
VRSAFGQIVSNAFAADADKVAADKSAELEKALAETGDDITRWTEARGEELNRALADVREVAPARLAEGLRSVADWLEKRATDLRPAEGGETGESVNSQSDLDRLFSSLEKSFGALFVQNVQKPDAEAADKDDAGTPKPDPSPGDDGN